MPKVKNHGRASQARQESRSVDQEVSSLGKLAAEDRGYQRDSVSRGTPLEDEPERQARREGADAAAYERISGKRNTGARKQMQQKDERRPGLELDEDDEEELEEEETTTARDGEPEELEDADGDEDADDEAEAPRISKKKLASATTALKRAGAPAWVYDEDPERILELAESFAGYQSNADRVLSAKDEAIRALSSALGGKGKQAGAEPESPETETPSEEDLERTAEGLARSLGVEADAGTKKALVEFGRAARKGASSSAEKQELARLRSTVADMLIDQGIRGVRRGYAEHLSDPDARGRLRKRMIALDSEGGFGDDIGRLAKEAARSLWGEPLRAKEGRARARKSGAPVTQGRRDERRSKAPELGTEEHDRAVFRRVTQDERSRFAVRR